MEYFFILYKNIYIISILKPITGSVIERRTEKVFRLPLLELRNKQDKAPISIKVKPKTLFKALTNITLPPRLNYYYKYILLLSQLDNHNLRLQISCIAYIFVSSITFREI